MSIAERIAANQSNQPASAPAQTPAPTYQPDQFWKSVKGAGLLASLDGIVTDDMTAALWHALTEEPWGCLAQNIIGALPYLTAEELELLPSVIATNMRGKDATSGDPIKNWTFDYDLGEGYWVKMIDSSVIHFQQVRTGVHLSAWLYKVFGGNNRNDQVPLNEAIVHHSILGLGANDMKEEISEALSRL